MSNYHTTKSFSVSFLAIEMKKINVKMNKPIYLGFSILEISKTLMYQSWYDYMKPKHKEKAKLCYTDTDKKLERNSIRDWINKRDWINER